MTERALRLADQRGRDRLTAAREAGSASPPHPDDRSAAPLGRACRRKGQPAPTRHPGGRVVQRGARLAHDLSHVCHRSVTTSSRVSTTPRGLSVCAGPPAARGPIGREALPAAPVGLRGPCGLHGGLPLPVRTAPSPSAPSSGRTRSKSLVGPPAIIAGEPVSTPRADRRLGIGPIDPVALPRADPPGRPGVQAVQVRRVMSRWASPPSPCASGASLCLSLRAPCLGAVPALLLPLRSSLTSCGPAAESQVASPLPTCKANWMRCCAERLC